MSAFTDSLIRQKTNERELAHPEFRFKPKTPQDSKEWGELHMAYIRKILKSGSIGKLPYDKTTKVSEKPDYNEQELLQQLPPAGMFEDLHDKSVCP